MSIDSLSKNKSSDQLKEICDRLEALSASISSISGDKSAEGLLEAIKTQFVDVDTKLSNLIQVISPHSIEKKNDVPYEKTEHQEYRDEKTLSEAYKKAQMPYLSHDRSIDVRTYLDRQKRHQKYRY